MTTHYQTNKHKYNDDEVISALQKDIRRGNESQSMWWALEISDNGNSKNGFSRLINRLKIILYEDIGLGNPNIIHIIRQAIDDMVDMYENDNEWRILLSFVILLMCKSSKSRITDDFAIISQWNWNNNPSIPIPDYALDMHTTRGKKLGRGLKHFRNEGIKLNNELVIDDNDIIGIKKFYKDIYDI